MRLSPYTDQPHLAEVNGMVLQNGTHAHTDVSGHLAFGVGALTALWVYGGLPEGLSPVFFVELLVVFSAFIFHQITDHLLSIIQ